MLHPLTAIVTCLALAPYFAFSWKVGRARAKYKIAAPATVGHPDFERIFRVHQNTLENLMIFLPGLWRLLCPSGSAPVGFRDFDVSGKRAGPRRLHRGRIEARDDVTADRLAE